jgi:hypothetical protein
MIANCTCGEPLVYQLTGKGTIKTYLGKGGQEIKNCPKCDKKL